MFFGVERLKLHDILFYLELAYLDAFHEVSVRRNECNPFKNIGDMYKYYTKSGHTLSQKFATPRSAGKSD